MIIIDIDNSLELERNSNLENSQNSFLESSLGKVVDTAVNFGLRAVLPNCVEDEIIEIKDTLINEGFSEAVDKTIENAINIGKSAIGIVTGKFENVSQAEKAVETGGIIDGVSDALDFTLNKVNKLNLIPNNILTLIKNGKDVVLKNISSNIKKEFKNQSINVETLDKYNLEWKEAFDNQNLETMDKVMKKISKLLNKTLPLESTINNARKIENIHELIKNNGGDFNLSEEQLKLANLL